MIERVILNAGAMLIFSVSFQIDQMPEGEIVSNFIPYIRIVVVLVAVVGECAGSAGDKAPMGT